MMGKISELVQNRGGLTGNWIASAKAEDTGTNTFGMVTSPPLVGREVRWTPVGAQEDAAFWRPWQDTFSRRMVRVLVSLSLSG